MLDFQAQNTNNRVVINPVPWQLATKLKNVIFKEIQKYPVGVKLISALRDSKGNGKNVADVLSGTDIEFSNVLDFIKDCLIGLDTNEAIQSTLYECLAYCTYQSTRKINAQLFDDVPEAREDYYEIVAKCLECNLRPFLKSLQSQFSTLFGIAGNSPILDVILTENSK